MEKELNIARNGKKKAFDFKREYNGFYSPKNVPEIVMIPKMSYVVIKGIGNPNEENGL